MERKLKTGVAYHGNRMLSHAIEDMKDIARSDMDIVVHMLSHTDWERHSEVMKDIFAATEAEGLEVWVDNWGIGGAPGDKSHFLAYHPEAHSYYGNGNMHPYQICLNSPAYRQFVKNWVDKVAELGGKTVFWDEPLIPEKKADDGRYYSSCTCPTCQKIFEDRFGKKMPEFMDSDVSKFRNETTVDFYNFASSYASSQGLKNVICFMPHQLSGMQSVTDNFLSIDLNRICAMENIDSIGTDPYWYGSEEIAKTGNPYEFVYNSTKLCVDVANSYKKEHNLWIQTYNVPAGREDEIITAYEAAYDAGARNVIAWSYRGGEANDYRAKNVEKTWFATKEGARRIKSMDRDRLLDENRKKYMK